MSLSKILGTRAISVVVAVLGCLLLDAVLHQFINEFAIRLFMLGGLYITLSVSLNLINGITGQFSIGHAGFYMVGAYAAGLASNTLFAKQPLDMPAYLIVSVVIGALAAAIAGLIVGLPSLRLKGDYLAIVTLGFGEIIRIVAINQESWGGSYGLNIAPKQQSLAAVFLLAIVCIAVCRNLLKSAHGLAFLAVREDEIAAQAMGVNLTRAKVTAFVVGAAFAGAAGALFAHSEGFVNPDLFKMEVSFLILTMVVLGGTGSITGSAVAAGALFLIPELPRILPFTVSLGMLIGLAIGIVAFVWTNRRLLERYHGPQAQRPWVFLGASLGTLLGGSAIGLLLHRYTIMGDKIYEANAVRWVILSVVLLVVMLIRPTGLMGHHEFSWDWVKSKLKGQSAKVEV
jgi:branched-chain amino acid transport system permease protein